MPKLIRLIFVVLPFTTLLAQNNDDKTKVRAAVEARYQEWLAAENKKDAVAITELYDDNAVLMPKAEEFVIGKSAIGEYYKKQAADPHFVPFTLNLDWNSFYTVGDIAVATALFEGDATRNEKQIHFRGKDLLVWKRQADGSWKIFRYMYDEIPAKK